MLFKFNQIRMNIFSLDLLCRTQAVKENLKKKLFSVAEVDFNFLM